MSTAKNNIDSFAESFINFPSRFENPRLIAKGANSDVYAARDSVLDRMVAIKVLFADSQHKLASHEVRLLASLNHPGIIRLLDVCHSDDASLLILHYCHKGSMDQERSSLELSYLRKMAAIETLVQAVRYLHNQGWMHCDIKPANILIDERDRFFLSDFGDARPIQQPKNAPEVVGSVGYMAPELLLGESGPSVASEVYSIGVAIYELLSGSSAFSSEPVVAMQEATSKGIPRLARSIPSSADWDSIIQKACNQKSASRYSTVQEIADDVQCVRDDKPVSARKMGVLEQLTRIVRREPITTGLVCAVFLVIFIGAIASGLAWVEASNQLARSKSNQLKLERLSDEATQAKKNLDQSLAAANTESEKAKKLEAETEATILSAASLREKLQNESTAAKKLNLELATTVADLSQSLSKQKESERKSTEVIDKVETQKNNAMDFEYWQLMSEARKLLTPESYSRAIELMNKSNPSSRRLEYYLMQGLAQNQRPFPERTEVGTIEFDSKDELTKYDMVSNDGLFYVRCSRKEVKVLSLRNGVLSSLKLPNFNGLVGNIWLRFNQGSNKLIVVRAGATECDVIMIRSSSNDTWIIEHSSKPIEGNCFGVTGFNGERIFLACTGTESGAESIKFVDPIVGNSVWNVAIEENSKPAYLLPDGWLPIGRSVLLLSNNSSILVEDDGSNVVHRKTSFDKTLRELGLRATWYDIPSGKPSDRSAAAGGKGATDTDRRVLANRFSSHGSTRDRYASYKSGNIVLRWLSNEIGLLLDDVSIPLTNAASGETLLGVSNSLEVFSVSYRSSANSTGKDIRFRTGKEPPLEQLTKATVIRYNYGCQNVPEFRQYFDPVALEQRTLNPDRSTLLTETNTADVPPIPDSTSELLMRGVARFNDIEGSAKKMTGPISAQFRSNNGYLPAATLLADQKLVVSWSFLSNNYRQRNWGIGQGTVEKGFNNVLDFNDLGFSSFSGLSAASETGEIYFCAEKNSEKGIREVGIYMTRLDRQANDEVSLVLSKISAEDLTIPQWDTKRLYVVYPNKIDRYTLPLSKDSKPERYFTILDKGVRLRKILGKRLMIGRIKKSGSVVNEWADVVIDAANSGVYEIVGKGDVLTPVEGENRFLRYDSGYRATSFVVTELSMGEESK